MSLWYLALYSHSSMSSFIQNFSLQHFNSMYRFSNYNSFGTSKYKLSVTSSGVNSKQKELKVG